MFLVATLGALISTLPVARATTVVFSHDVLGELEPCGCRSNPSGGLDRKAMLLEQERRLHPKEELIQVDTGDLLFDSADIPDLLKKQKEEQARALLKGHKKLGHQLILPGEKDFALGTTSLLRMAKESGITFIAGNLYDKKTKKPLFQTQWKSPSKVLFLAVVGKDLNFPKDVEVRDPIRTILQGLKDRGDAHEVVILTHQGLEADQKLAKAIPKNSKVDVRIIGAHSQSFLQQPYIENEIPIGQTSFRNQAIGFWKISHTTGNLEYKLKILDESLSPKSDGAKDLVTAQVKDIEKLIEETKKKVADQNQEITRQSLKDMGAETQEIQTWVRCAECHQKQWKFWRDTGHARAWKTLFEAKSHENLECLSCHSVGMGQKTGFNTAKGVSPFATYEELSTFLKDAATADALEPVLKKHPLANEKGKVFTPVQCENCHGNGNSHPFGNGLKPIPPTLASVEGVCVKCHLYERAPTWYTKDKKLDPKIVLEKIKSVACPRDSEASETQ
ncbi:MAG: hypothetical protein JNL01_16920 [Bdellovibrionales bacterium]|nr:hypothetical protein [Bdellovibrionales bacterium]